MGENLDHKTVRNGYHVWVGLHYQVDLPQGVVYGTSCSPCTFTLPVCALLPSVSELKTTQTLIVYLIYMFCNCKGLFPIYIIECFLITWCAFASVEPSACYACRAIYILPCLGTTFRTIGIQPLLRKVFELWKQAIKIRLHTAQQIIVVVPNPINYF